jgi:hypothetical protein
LHPESSFLLSFFVFFWTTFHPESNLQRKLYYEIKDYASFFNYPLGSLWLLPKRFLNYTKIQIKVGSSIKHVYNCFFFFFFWVCFSRVMPNIIVFIRIRLEQCKIVPVIINRGHVLSFLSNNWFRNFICNFM